MEVAMMGVHLHTQYFAKDYFHKITGKTRLGDKPWAGTHHHLGLGTHGVEKPPGCKGKAARLAMDLVFVVG